MLISKSNFLKKQFRGYPNIFASIDCIYYEGGNGTKAWQCDLASEKDENRVIARNIMSFL